MKNFSWTNQPRPISKCKLVLDVYFRPFSSILEVMFFWKMAICEYLILVIFGQFWLFRADFAPKMWKVYLFQLFRWKNNNGIKKNGSMWLFQKSGPRTHPGPKNTEKWPQEGQNWRQCTSCGPTNWFRAKKNKLESVTHKLCPFHSESPCVELHINLFLYCKTHSDKCIKCGTECQRK